MFITSRAPLALAVMLISLMALACTSQAKAGFSANQFQQADRQLQQAITAAERGDLKEAESQFLAAHFFLQQIDLPMRNRGHEELANAIFDMKSKAQEEFTGGRRADEVVRLTRGIRDRLPEAAKALGVTYNR